MGKLIVANWKMNLSKNAVKLILNAFSSETIHDVVICPSFIHINSALSWVQSEASNFKIGAQDCAAYDDGAYTGDVSARMLSDIGCSHVIIGHSERRAHHNETNELIKFKISLASAAGLQPIVCIGESLGIKNNGLTLQFLLNQIDALSLTQVAIIAYEPLWAIGTGATPSITEINEIAVQIKNQYPRNKLLYGGSVNEHNAAAILSLTALDGLLVGGVSLKPESFNKLLGLQ